MSEFAAAEESNAYTNSLDLRGEAESAADGALGEHVASEKQQVYANTRIAEFAPLRLTADERGLSV